MQNRDALIGCKEAQESPTVPLEALDAQGSPTSIEVSQWSMEECLKVGHQVVQSKFARARIGEAAPILSLILVKSVGGRGS